MDPVASELVEAHYRHAINFARSIFPREDEIDSVACEMLCVAAIKWVEHGYEGSFWQWAIGSIKYDLIDWWRAKYGRHEHSARRRQYRDVWLGHGLHTRDGEYRSYDDVLAYDELHPDEIVISHCERERILAFFERRSVRRNEREVIKKRLEGKTLAQIGEELGFTESRACQIMGKARKKLEAYMEM